MCSSDLGLVLAIGFRHVDRSGFSNELAGCLLGLLLLTLGAAVLISGGKQVITVDPARRRIVIEGHGRFRRTRKDIRFSDIKGTSVGRIGSREDGSESYHVSLALTSGQDVALFLGFFEGAHSRPAMEARRQRLQAMLQASAAEAPQHPSAS